METLRDECVFRPLNEDFVFVMMGGRLKGLSGPNTFTCRNLHCQCVCVCVCVCVHACVWPCAYVRYREKVDCVHLFMPFLSAILTL